MIQFAQGKPRNSNIEGLRILAILAIIAGHFSFHGLFSAEVASKASVAANWDIYSWILGLFSGAGTFGNCIFILITGYFMIKKDSINSKRILLLILAMYFYYWIINIGFLATDNATPSIKQMAGFVAPFLFGTHWFVCAYILFCLFIPYINKFLNALSKTEFQKFLVIVFTLGFVMPDIGMSSYFVAKDMVIFGIMYSFGAYIRLYRWPDKMSASIRGGQLLIITVALIGIATEVLGLFFGSPAHSAVLPAALAIIVFIYTLQMRPFCNTTVNTIAKSVLGIYLIHETPVMRKFLWQQFYPNIDYLHSPDIFILFFSKVIGVFLICLVVDQLRIMFIEKPLSSHINPLMDRFTLLLNKWEIK